MENNNFHEIDLRCENVNLARPRSAHVGFFNRVLRKTFSRKKRRVTTAVADSELMKNSISSPSNVCKVSVEEEDFTNSRNSIVSCPFNISGYGEFLLMDEFIVKKPEKMVLMMFLYEKIIIFTKKKSNEESYYYVGSIKMNHLGLEPNSKNLKILMLKDHYASARFHKEIIFTLKARSEYIQSQWRKALEKCLWNQLLEAKKTTELEKSQNKLT
ncbi:hypothetical protein ABEB36_002878 [Hypothenemus hampei]|uniref:SOS1/NGEF-like PH domain-containing protein n=1 Tax=Hypothenemus hampei TaxID=57062 RepID=A0ABD1FAE9_HYPHA